MPVEIQEFHKNLPESVAIQLVGVYVDSPEVVQAEQVLEQIRQGLAAGDRYYAGYFNGHYICGVLIHDEVDHRSMRFLAVHPATRGRGVAERLVDEVRRLETLLKPGHLVTQFDTSDHELVSIFLAMGFLPHRDGQFRCTLS